MKKNFTLLILSFFLINNSLSQNISAYQYLSPLPESTENLPSTSISIRFGEYLEDLPANAINFISVSGLNQHTYNGRVVLALDKKTIVWYGASSFKFGDKITFVLRSGFKTLTGKTLPELRYYFSITPTDINNHSLKHVPYDEDSTFRKYENSTADPFAPLLMNVTVNNNPAPGYLFFGFGSSLFILDNELTPVLWKKASSTTYDFKLQPNGLMTYFDYDEAHFIALDSAARFARYYSCGNGFWNDAHELMVKESGNYYILGKEDIRVNLTELIPGGQENAKILGMAIQECDADGNVLFQWRTWDHYDLQDADSLVKLTQVAIDYAHCNSIEEDTDGNIILSTRNFNEVTKINRETGAIMWRLGGENNQFEFINDDRGFNRQHDARVLSNGNISIFDNGHYSDPAYSSYVVYDLDTDAMTATLVRRHSANDTIYTRFRGNAQELPNGNIYISWGENMIPGISEIDENSNTVFEIVFDEYYHKYRSFKFEWETNRFDLNTDSLNFGTLDGGDSLIKSFWVHNPESNPLFLKGFITNSPSFTIVEKGVINVPGKDSLELHLKFKPLIADTFSHTLTVQHYMNTSIVGKQIAITGICTSYIKTPANLLAFSPSSQKVVLEWLDRSDNEDGFIIYRKLGLENSSQKFVAIDSTKENITKYIDTTAVSDTSFYTYTIEAYNQFATSGKTEPVVVKTPLPVELTTLQAEQQGKNVVLVWETASEINNNGFEIHRAIFDGTKDTLYNMIGFIPGKGSTTEPQKYQYKDSTVTTSANLLYRLKQVDFNGTYEFSSVLSVQYSYVPDRLTLYQNYPNPFNPETIISYAIPSDGYVTVSVYNAQGREVAILEQSHKKAGEYKITFNASHLASGMYFYRVLHNKKSVTKKMILMK